MKIKINMDRFKYPPYARRSRRNGGTKYFWFDKYYSEGNLVFRWLGEEHWPALESCLFCLFFFICLSRLCEAKNYYNSTHDRVLRNLHAESLSSSSSSIIGKSVHFRTNRSRAACNILEERIISLTCVLFPRPESSTVAADILGISSFWTNCNENGSL